MSSVHFVVIFWFYILAMQLPVNLLSRLLFLLFLLWSLFFLPFFLSFCWNLLFHHLWSNLSISTHFISFSYSKSLFQDFVYPAFLMALELKIFLLSINFFIFLDYLSNPSCFPLQWCEFHVHPLFFHLLTEPLSCWDDQTGYLKSFCHFVLSQAKFSLTLFT